MSMGILSFLAKNTYKGICRTMINSYNKVKKQNPKATKRELYALALSLRPTWKRENLISFTFIRGKYKLYISDGDNLKDVVAKIILIETFPTIDSLPLEVVINAITKMPTLSEMLNSRWIANMFPFAIDKGSVMTILKEISEVLDEEFEDFKE